MIFQLSEDIISFPKPELANEDGLLAVGGDLSPARLILAYQNGIFPWFSEESPILWYAPHKRFVLFPEKLKISKTMLKFLKTNNLKVTYDTAFPEVIRACATISRDDELGTWITNDMEKAYIQLFELGYAHSVEVWENDQLVGGLYGVEMNSVFCGESMFSKVSNASKLALISLCQNHKYKLIDCQVHSDHLESLGAEFISTNQFVDYLI